MGRVDLSELRAKLAERQQMVADAAQQGVQDAKLQLAERYVEDAKGIADREIAVFYADYSPRRYRRRYSLYDIPDIRTVGDLKIVVDFDPEGTSFRDGYDGEDGLYDQVFRKGWHGGADSGPGHPSPGTPYWRAGRNFSRWGEPAAIAGTSPLEGIDDALTDYERTQLPSIWRGLVAQCIQERIRDIGVSIGFGS